MSERCGRTRTTGSPVTDTMSFGTPVRAVAFLRDRRAGASAGDRSGECLADPGPRAGELLVATGMPRIALAGVCHCWGG